MADAMTSLYEFCWDRWYKAAKERAMEDPVYAAEENLRRTETGSWLMLDSDNGFTMDRYIAHTDLFDKINPTPFWIKLHHWRDRKGLRYRYVKRNLQAFWQRGRRGYADTDLWSFDSYLAGVLVKALAQLRDTTHGYPSGLDTPEEWAAILTQMVDGFAAHRDIMNTGDTEAMRTATERFQRGMELFSEYYLALWD